jgi:hypothetical protein
MIAQFLKGIGVTSAVLCATAIAVFAQATTPAPGPAPALAPPPAPATAAPSKSDGAMAACRADMKALCAQTPRGGGAKMQCLVQNKAKTSPECQAAMVTIQDRIVARGGRRGGLAACKADAATLCAEGMKGKARNRCLRENAAKVSPACAEAIAALPKGRGATATDAAPASAPATTVPATPAPVPKAQ